MDSPITALDTARLRLRPLTHEDAGFILRLLNEPGFVAHIGDKGVRDEADALRYLDQGPISSYRTHRFGLLAVEHRDDRQPVGICGLLQRPWLPEPDLGYALVEACWGQGLAVEAGRAVLDDARSRLRLQRLLAVVDAEHAASLAVLHKLGFMPRTWASPSGNQALRLLACDLQPACG